MVSYESFYQAARTYAGGNPQAQKDYVENLPKVCETLARSLNWNALEALHATLQEAEEPVTLGLMGTLYIKAKSNDFSVNFETFLVQFANFIESPSTDANALRMCPVLVTGTCECIAEQVTKRKQPIIGINLMCSVISKIQLSPRQLTGVHSVLLQLCLSAHCLKPALPFLVDDIDDFTNDLRGSDCKNLLLYFYYGGMILAALKRFTEAIYFFEACTRTPASTLSHIMLEAYKKYVLICLIHTGEVPQPHKSAVQVITRILKPGAQPYTDLATAFASHNPTELTNCMARHQEVYRRDNNFGLVKQVKSAQTRINIQRLTKTFLTLSLADVASRVQLSSAHEAEKNILRMIQDGNIYAKINQRDGMVVFLDNKERYDNPEVLKKLEDQISRCVELNKRLSEMNEKLETNPEFISKVVLTSGGTSGNISGTIGMSEDQNEGNGISAVASSSSSGKLGSFNM